MAKVKWKMERVIGKYRVYARMSRSEIIVRIENDGDTSKYAELGYPKVVGIMSAMDLGAKEVRPEEIRE